MIHALIYPTYTTMNCAYQEFLRDNHDDIYRARKQGTKWSVIMRNKEEYRFMTDLVFDTWKRGMRVSDYVIDYSWRADDDNKRNY